MSERCTAAAFTWKDVLISRNEIFGLAALWIVLFHIREYLGMGSFPGSYLLVSVIVVGNCGVDIFLFLSAVGLYHSMQTHSPAVFYRNRARRIILPYLMAAIPYFIWYDFLFMKDGVWQFAANVLTVNYWLAPKYPIWYVSFVVVIYALFPLIYRADVKTGHKSTIGLIILSVAAEYLLMKTGSAFFNNAERAMSRLPVFLLGVALAPYILRGGKITRWQVAVAFAGAAAVFCVVTFADPYLVLERYLYCPLAVCIIVAFSYIRKVLPLKPLFRCFGWVGGISFELYAVHVLLVKGIHQQKLWRLIDSKLVWYVLIVAGSVAAAKLICVVSGRPNSWLFPERRDN